MSEENLEVVRRCHEAVARRDWDTAMAAYSPDTVWDDRNVRPEGALHRGRDALLANMRAWFGAWTHYRFEVERLIEAGDLVVSIVREQGEGKGSGVAIDQTVGMVVAVRDGLIAETTVYRDPARALEAAGLPPSDG